MRELYRVAILPRVEFILLAAILGAIPVVVFWMNRGEPNPSRVEHGNTVTSAGVELALEWVDYGGTGTMLLLAGRGPGGERVSVQAESIEAEGFQTGPPVVLYETGDGVKVRLPRVDLDAAAHSLSVSEVVLHTGADDDRRAGEWTFTLDLPPEGDREDAFRIEELRFKAAAQLDVEIKATRSAVETLVELRSPGLVPAGPPEMRHFDEQGPVLGVEVDAFDSQGEFHYSFPPTRFGEPVEVWLPPMVVSDDSKSREMTVDFIDRLGRPLQFGEDADIELADRSGNGLRISRIRAFSEYDSRYADANLILYLEGYLTPGVLAQGQGVPAESDGPRLAVRDAQGRLLHVVSTGRRTGSVLDDGTVVPARSDIMLQFTESHDLSSVTVTITSVSEVVHPGQVTLLYP